MIEITNGKEKFFIKENELKKCRNYYTIIVENDFICINLHFVLKKIDNAYAIKQIEKRLASSSDRGGDVEKIYPNLIKSNNKVMLNDKDYIEVKRLKNNLKTTDEDRINTIIECYANMMAYECYMAFIIEELGEVRVEHIFKDTNCDWFSSQELKKYKNKIYNKTKNILKEKYKVNLDAKFKEEERNE